MKGEGREEGGERGKGEGGSGYLFTTILIVFRKCPIDKSSPLDDETGGKREKT